MGVLSRIVFDQDTTPPSTPLSVAASALSQTALRITWAASTDTGGSGLSGYRVLRSTTSGGTYTQIGSDLSVASLSYDDTGLSAGATCFYRVVAFDGRNNVSSQSSTASATTQSGSVGGDGNDGLIVTNYASWDPDAASIISLDVNTTIPRAVSGGSIATYDPAGSWWNGATGVYTWQPPTTPGGYCGFSGIQLWKSATKNVKQINIRQEFRLSAEFCADAINHPKYMIVRVYPNFNAVTPGTPARPIIFLENMTETGNPSIDLHNTLFLCHAQGTFRYFSSTNIIPGPTQADYNDVVGPARGPIMRQPFYFSANAGADLSGNPIIAASEIVCLELRTNVMPTADEPNAVIAYRLYRRNGQVFERGCAWTWDANYTPGANNYIADVDTMGLGNFNGGNPTSPGLYTQTGRRVTVGFNLAPSLGRYWMGPPAGFVQ